MDDLDRLSWLVEQGDIRSLRAAVCDLNGVMRGKRIPVEQAEKVLAGGLRMPLSVVGVDVWGEDIKNSPLVFTTGDADGLCEPIGRGILPMDWTPEPTRPHPAVAARGKRHAVWRRSAPGAGGPGRALCRGRSPSGHGHGAGILSL